MRDTGQELDSLGFFWTTLLLYYGVWIGDGIGENTETAVDGFRGADGVLFIKDREDCKLPFVTETSHIVHYIVLGGDYRTAPDGLYTDDLLDSSN